jgi:prepilin peptidase CpaA
MKAMCVLILLTSGTAMLTDLRTGRIPNTLIVTAALAGLASQIASVGAMGILHFLAGASIPALLLVPLFRFRMMGAGDIKLLMVLGGMVGFPEVLDLCLWSFVVGGIVAVCKMIFVTGVKERLLYLLRYVRDTGRSGKIVPYRKPGRRPENFPFAVPVFAAAVLVVGRYAHIFV